MEFEQRKRKVLEMWRLGDDGVVAREVQKLYPISISRVAVRWWRTGVRPNSRLKEVILHAAESVQTTRQQAEKQKSRDNVLSNPTGC